MVQGSSVRKESLDNESKPKLSYVDMGGERMGKPIQPTIVVSLVRNSEDVDRNSRSKLILAKKHRDIDVIL